MPGADPRIDLGTDLELMPVGGPRGALQLQTNGGDLSLVSGLANLAQAIRLRLSTPVGDLAHLGHPVFGSRLQLLIGRLANPATLLLAQAYVREALRDEARIAEVIAVDVQPDPTALGTLLIQLAIRPVDMAAPVQLSLTFALEPGPARGERK